MYDDPVLDRLTDALTVVLCPSVDVIVQTDVPLLDAPGPRACENVVELELGELTV